VKSKKRKRKLGSIWFESEKVEEEEEKEYNNG